MSDSKVLRFPGGAAEPVRRYRAVLPRAAMRHVNCAFCDSPDTEPTAIYGANMMLSQYYCHACKSSFDLVRND